MNMRELPLGELRPVWVPVAWVSLLTNLLMLVPTLYMLQIFDRVLSGSNEWTLLFLSLITLYLYGVLAASEWLRTRMLVNASVRFEQWALPAVFRSQMGTRKGDSGGWQPEWITRLSEVRQFLSGPSLLIVIDLCMTPIFVFALFVLHPWLAAFALVMMALQFGLARATHAQSGQMHRRVADAWQQENRSLGVSLRHFDTSLALGIEAALHQQWRGLRARALQAWRQQHSSDAKAASLGKFVRYAQQGLGLGLGAWLVIRGELSAGAMIAANILTTRSLGPIEQWASSWTQMLLAIDSHRKLVALAGQAPAPSTPPVPSIPPVPSTRPASPDQHTAQPWTVHQLLLLAEGRAQPVIRHLSVTLSPSQITAVHGPSGAGKSSLLKAMLGQWPAELMKGQIRLGPDLADQRHWLTHGHRVGYLAQRVELFQGSITENIARMGLQSDPQQVVAAARQVGIHDQILALPKGYDTRLEGGFALSSGLRQRIGIARAVYGNPPWLLLDEPSASLDEASTEQLLQTLRALQAQGVGIVLTTHNPQLIQMADRRLRLESGVLIQP